VPGGRLRLSSLCCGGAGEAGGEGGSGFCG
jgi:hypothetical protein